MSLPLGFALLVFDNSIVDGFDKSIVNNDVTQDF